MSKDSFPISYKPYTLEDTATNKYSGQSVFLCFMIVVSLFVYINGKNYLSIEHPEASIAINNGYVLYGNNSIRPSELNYGRNTSFRPGGIQSTHNEEKLDKNTALWVTTLIDLVVPPNRIWSIYLPHSTFKIEYYVNGLELADIVMATNANDNGSHSSLVSIPNGVLRSGSNEIQLKLIPLSEKTSSSIPQFLMGPLSEIAPYYQSQTFFSESFPQAVVTLLLIFGVALFLVWMNSRKDKFYLVFSTCSFLWAGYLATMLPTIQLSFDSSLLSHISSMFLLGFSISLTYLCLLYASSKTQKYFGLFILTGSSILLVALLATELRANQINDIIHISAIFLIGSGIASLISRIGRLPPSAFVLLPALLILCFQIIDQSVQPQVPYGSNYSPLQFTAPVFIAIAVIKMIRDFIASVNNLAIINENLESTIQERTHQIKSEMAERRLAEQKVIISDERNRLMMEMHDGLGARLVGAIAQTENRDSATDVTDIRDELKEILNELRLVIDSLNPADGNLAIVLAMFRKQLQKSLSRTEKQLIWQTTEIHALQTSSPEKTLNVLRILQEATTNAIKYSSGNSITINARSLQNNRICISVTDNGAGFSLDSVNRGHGLKNMQQRADKIGAEIEFHSSNAGFSVILTLDGSEPALSHPADNSDSQVIQNMAGPSWFLSTEIFSNSKFVPLTNFF